MNIIYKNGNIKSVWTRNNLYIYKTSILSILVLMCTLMLLAFNIDGETRKKHEFISCF